MRGPSAGEDALEFAAKAVRAKSANVADKDGVPLFKWADIDDARLCMSKGACNRNAALLLATCYALPMKVDHYNDAHPGQEPIQVPFDLSEDIEDLKIANGLEEAA